MHEVSPHCPLCSARVSSRHVLVHPVQNNRLGCGDISRSPAEIKQWKGGKERRVVCLNSRTDDLGLLGDGLVRREHADLTASQLLLVNFHHLNYSDDDFVKWLSKTNLFILVVRNDFSHKIYGRASFFCKNIINFKGNPLIKRLNSNIPCRCCRLCAPLNGISPSACSTCPADLCNLPILKFNVVQP